jgi:hypothetical protein
MKIFKVGRPTDRINRIITHAILKGLKKENPKYIVGIDWGSPDKDSTVINYGLKHEDGTMEMIGSRKVDYFEKDTYLI